VFDWLFGTLPIPLERAERLTFGVEPSQHAPHTIAGGLITPLVRAFGMIPGFRHAMLLVASRAAAFGSHPRMRSSSD
jgi:hypothetical protein